MRSAVCGADLMWALNAPCPSALQLQYGGWGLRRRTTSSRFFPKNCWKAAAVSRGRYEKRNPNRDTRRRRNLRLLLCFLWEIIRSM